MKGGIFFGFFGILLINQCNCLKKDQKYNNLAGVYFNNVGTYNFVDNKDETFLTSFTLTGLENTLSNAKTYNYESLTLEENLNNIYKVCNRNRKNYLPYESTMIPENQISSEMEKALKDSASILSDLISLSSKNYTEKFDVRSKINKTYNYAYDYLYPKHVQDFEVAKKYVNFKFNLEKISGNAAVINVKVLVPVLVKGQLNRLFYVPKNILESQEVEILKDQSMKNLVVSTDRGSRSYNSEYGFFLLKNMDSCQLFNETFLCDPSAMIKVEKSSDTCITSLYFSDCKYFTNNDCRKVNEKCSFEKTTNFKEFTHISENIFFAIFKRNSKLNFKEGEVNYIYKCEDGRQELGTLIFDKWVTNKFTGTVEVEENCSLITAHSSIINKDGVFEIQEIDNEEMIWADTPKIIGIPIWIFTIVVSVICLIVLGLLITWICICIRRCKKYRGQYANVTNSPMK